MNDEVQVCVIRYLKENGFDIRESEFDAGHVILVNTPFGRRPIGCFCSSHNNIEIEITPSNSKTLNIYNPNSFPHIINMCNAARSKMYYSLALRSALFFFVPIMVTFFIVLAVLLYTYP